MGISESTQLQSGETRGEGENDRTRTEHECSECGGDVITDDGERICEDCGLVIDDDNIDRGPEWRAFDSKEQNEKSRVGAPTTKAIHDKGLTTQIDWRNKDAYGNSLSTEKRSQLSRLRTWQERIRTKDAGERNLKFALSEVDRMGSALGLPQPVRTTASVIYRRALDEDLIRGRSIEGVATAVVYAACRIEGIPRSLEEVSAVSRVERKEIARTHTYIQRELGLEVQPAQPEDFIPRYCGDLDVSNEVKNRAREIVEDTKEELLSGKAPTGYAAAAIYAASLLCNEPKTQREIAEVADVTEVTIRNHYKEQVEAMGVNSDIDVPHTK